MIHEFIAKSVLASALIIVATIHSPALAQSISYVDESGNINFVERVDEVPEQYRDQVIKKKTERLTGEQYKHKLASWKEQQRDAQKRQKDLEKEKKRELKRQERELRKSGTVKEKKGKDDGTGKRSGKDAVATPTPQVVKK